MRSLSHSCVSNKCDVLWCMAVFIFSLLTVTPLFAKQGNAGKPPKEEVIQEIQKLQVPFIVNNGQIDERVRFYAKTFGGTVFVTKDGEIVYSLPKSEVHNPKSPVGVVLKEELIGAKVSGIKGEQEAIMKVSYFTGNDPSKWKSNIQTYEYVDLGEVYDGIGLRLKAYGNNVEKLFCVKPGADAGKIKIRLEGIQTPESSMGEEIQPPESPFIKGDSKLSKREGNAQSTKNPPLSPASGGQPPVPLIEGDKGGGMSVKSPLDLVVSTQSNEHEAMGLAVKSPIEKGVRQIASKSILDGVVSDKSNEKGARQTAQKSPLEKGVRGLSINKHGELVAETELGPVKFTKPVAYQMIDGIRVNVDCGYWIAECGLRSAKDEYKTTDFTDYADTKETQIQNPKPVVSEVEPSETRNPNSKAPSPATRHSSPIYGFRVAQYDKTKDLIIDPLLASTYLGGSYEDYGKAIAVDAGGNVYVVGETLSSDLPTTSGAYDTSRNGNTDVYVLKFNSGLTNLLASTFLGGALNHDYCYSMAIDAGGNVFVVGATYSTDFPTTRGVYDAASNGRWDVFVSKFNSGLTKLLASTVLGKNSDEYGYSIAVDAGGNVYVAGITNSTNFPATPDAYDTSYNTGYCDAFVSKFNNDLTTLLASTFLGGNSGDYGMSITIDGSGNALVTGNTWSRNFPATTGVYNTAHNGGSDDVFISKFNSGLTKLLASTFLGGYSNDLGKSIAVDGGGHVYVTGETISPNFPTTTDAYDTSFNPGSKDTFISKFNSGLTGLSASTLLGGHSNDYGKSIAIDAGGNVYVTGATHSTDFPTTPGAYDTSANGGSDVFVSKFNDKLTSLLASTYHGGSRSDFGNSIAIDAGGNVYVTGETLSSDFPTMSGAYDPSYHRCEDTFVTIFNANLSADKANK